MLFDISKVGVEIGIAVVASVVASVVGVKIERWWHARDKKEEDSATVKAALIVATTEQDKTNTEELRLMLEERRHDSKTQRERIDQMGEDLIGLRNALKESDVRASDASKRADESSKRADGAAETIRQLMEKVTGLEGQLRERRNVTEAQISQLQAEIGVLRAALAAAGVQAPVPPYKAAA